MKPPRSGTLRNHTRFKGYLYGLLFLGLLQTSLAHAVLIGLQPDTSSVANGDSISLDLTISGLGSFSPASLGAFDVSIGFDPAALSFTGYSLGGFLGDPGLLEAIDASTGEAGGAVNIAEISLLSLLALDTLQPGEFTLATLSFGVTDLAVGATTQFSLLPGAVLGDAAGSGLQATVGPPVIIEGSSSIPVPGTLALLMSAFCGWNMLRRRQSGQREA